MTLSADNDVRKTGDGIAESASRPVVLAALICLALTGGPASPVAHPHDVPVDKKKTDSAEDAALWERYRNCDDDMSKIAPYGQYPSGKHAARAIKCLERMVAERRAEARAETLQGCQRELQSCKRRLSKTFLAFVVQWPTARHDVDLHVIDVAGQEFSYRIKRIPGRPGELSADTRAGPGVEIWEVPQAPPGEYRVLYNLYDRGGNAAPATVRGGVYHRNGHDRFRERRLTAVGRGNAVLAAVVTVRPDGSVDISER